MHNQEICKHARSDIRIVWHKEKPTENPNGEMYAPPTESNKKGAYQSKLGQDGGQQHNYFINKLRFLDVFQPQLKERVLSMNV